MDFSDWTTEKFVRHYNIVRHGDKVGSYFIPTDPAAREEVLAEMRKRKPEIMRYLIEREEAAKKEAEERRVKAEERQAKIDAIEGLAELRAAYADIRSWREEYNENIDKGYSGVGLRKMPQYDIKGMRARYPRAVNYLLAEGMANAAHYRKSGAGKKALERIINGEDGDQALKDAEAEWNDYIHENIWNI